MHIRYNAVSDNAKTEIQWNKLGYKVKPNSGTLAWSNGYCAVMAYYYEEDEVEPMTEDEIREYKQKLRLQRKIAKEKREKREKEKQEFYEYLDKWKTSVQWLTNGYVPNKNAKWELGEELNHGSCAKGSNYYYCYINDVTKDEEKAKEILETYDKTFENGGYNGLSWWS